MFKNKSLLIFILFLITFNIIPAMGETADDLLKHGEEAIKEIKPMKGITYFDKAIAIEPHSLKAWLYKAIAFNTVPDYEKMKECLNEAIHKDLIINKKTVNETLLDDWNALSFAVYCDNLEGVKLFIENGAAVDILDNNNSTALMLASCRGKRDIIKFLIDNGANPNLKDKNGYSALWCAAFYRQYDTVSYLISRGADKSDFPLFYAVCIDDIEMIKSLIDKGENVNSKGFNNQSPIHFVQSKEALELLLSAGADINSEDDEKTTPLYNAIDTGNKELVELFIKKGALVNITNVYGYTPLHEAVYYANEEIADVLISSGASVNKEGHLSETPLDWAKTEEMKRFLIKNGAKSGVIKVLVIVTSANKLHLKDGKELNTGYWAEELIEPLKIFREEITKDNIEIKAVVATLGGKKPVADEGSINPEVIGKEKSEEYIEAIASFPEINNPINLEEVNEDELKEYSAVFIVGGHGVIEDLANSDKTGHILSLAVTNPTQIVSAVCHGPLAFRSLSLIGKEKLLENIQMTGFSEEEEEAAKLKGKIPYELETTLKNMGASYSKTDKIFSPYIVSGGTVNKGVPKFITGENPASSVPLAQKLVEYLKIIKSGL